jgi:intracellular multiplication protein IcmL
MADKVEAAVETVTMREGYLKDNSRKILIALILCVVVILAQIIVITYVVTHPPEAKYFATSTDGRIMPLIPLEEPNLSQAALLQWANTAATAAYNYDFVNYREALQEASAYFTPDGWNSFMQALNESGSLQNVIDKKLMVTAVATGAPVIVDQGVLDGTYTWKVQMPMLINYQSASQNQQHSVTVTMLITRVATLTSARGIGIAQFIVSNSGD